MASQFDLPMDERQCGVCQNFCGQENVGEGIEGRCPKWPCYMDHEIPLRCRCGAYSPRKPNYSMTPENHPCPACNVKCDCGATRLDGTHVSPHKTFRFLDAAGRRVHIRDHHDRCVHKCLPGYGENWEPRR